MKTRYSILIISLLALFATGCKKENNGRIRIFAENMRGDGKIQIDPEDPNNSYWVAGEYISIGGTNYEINEDDEGFYIQCDNLSGTAIYPGSGDEYNDIEVIGSEVVIKRLTVNFLDEGSGNVDVVFPMAATANGDQLYFKHLTAGLSITLVAPEYEIEVASIKIVAQSTDPEMSNVVVNDDDIAVTARWSVQGPTLPHGDVGEATADYPASYASEMNIDFVTTIPTWNEDDEYVPYLYPALTLHGSENYRPRHTFYVPITINSLRYLTVTGYSTTGAQLFHVTKDLCPEEGDHEIAIEANKMYTLPDIVIGSDSDVGSNDEMD